MPKFNALVILDDTAADLSAFREAILGLLTDLKEQHLITDFVLKSTAPSKRTP